MWYTVYTYITYVKLVYIIRAAQYPQLQPVDQSTYETLSNVLHARPPHPTPTHPMTFVVKNLGKAEKKQNNKHNHMAFCAPNANY